jgi:hypothetical protein
VYSVNAISFSVASVRFQQLFRCPQGRHCGNPAGKKPGSTKDKPYRDALRMEIAALREGDIRGLRVIARAHLNKCKDGEMAAIKELADRLDGKPAQESTVTIEHKRNATDWTRAELPVFHAIAFCNPTY